MSFIRPLEKVLPSHLKNIEQMILSDKVINKPLIVDNTYNIVLDGSHRYAFLVKHGFKAAPVIKVDYDDEAIFVGNHLKHRFLKDEHFVISKSEIISRALNENLFDARTTRHFFPFRKSDYPVELAVLEKGNPQNIDFLIQDIPVAEEINKDIRYINEIDEEIKILQSYISEQLDVRKYLQKQIELMRTNV